MNNKLQQCIASFIGLAVLGVSAYSIWLVINWVAGLDTKIVGPTIAAIFGFAGIIYTQWSSKTREIAESHRPQKVAAYEVFFRTLERFMKNPERNESFEEDDDLPDDLRDQFWELNKGLIVWASPQVIQAWLNFRRVTSGSNDAQTIHYAVDDLLKAMRKDLGNSNTGLKPGDTTRIFLSDPDELK